MASNTVYCEVVARDLNEPTTIQLDEKNHALFVLTNYRLTRIDLTTNSNNAQIICQHNRRLQGVDTKSDEEYSQGESDDEMTQVSDPFEDSEPSSGDDEDKVESRRNWRRYAWRSYNLDNPCSILFLPEENRLIVLNEGVITLLTVDVENGRPFVQGPSKNIFCYDCPVFTQQSGVQPWSIASTSTSSFFVFSLLDTAQLYTLDMRNENTIIQAFIKTPVVYCPFLLFHPQSNTLFVYDSTQILAVSPADGTVVELSLPHNEKITIGAMAVDKTGHVYILSQFTIFKYTWQSQLHLVECLEKVNVPSTCAHMIVVGAGTEFYFSDMETSCVYRWKKESI